MNKPNIDAELTILVENLISGRMKFGEREKDIIKHRLAPLNYLKTLQELGDKWGVTRERIRQIEFKLREVLDNADGM